MFYVDTCFWLHLWELFAETGLDFRPVFHTFYWGFPDRMRQEYEHYAVEQFCPIETGYVIPLSAVTLSQVRQKFPTICELDEPDQELFAAALPDRGIILTDDGGLEMECLAAHIDALRVPPFLLALAEQGVVKKKEVAQALRFWEAQHWYKRSELRRWKQRLIQIR
jgi:hypothetical protein